jgi:hypothetical protein
METMIRMNPVSGLFETVIIEDVEDTEETVENKSVQTAAPSVKCNKMTEKLPRGKT